MRNKRILIVRMDGVGDALALAPLVAALRDAGHTLGAVLAKENRDAFAPGVFESVHELERIPWPRHGSTDSSYARVLDEVQTARYDVALLASEEPEAYRLAREARIRERVGFSNGLEKPLKSAWTWTMLTRSLLRPASAQREAGHEVETLFRLGGGLHAEPFPTRAVERLRPLVAGRDVERHGRVAVQLTRKLHALGVDARRVHEALREVAGTFPTIAVASPSEAPFGRTIADACGLEMEVPSTMDRWKRLLAGADAVVAPDSGAAHVAGMTGVGCVDLFADTPGAAHALQRWYPWASPRAWAIALTPRVVAALADQLLTGVAYVGGKPATAMR